MCVPKRAGCSAGDRDWQYALEPGKPDSCQQILQFITGVPSKGSFNLSIPSLPDLTMDITRLLISLKRNYEVRPCKAIPTVPTVQNLFNKCQCCYCTSFTAFTLVLLHEYFKFFSLSLSHFISLFLTFFSCIQALFFATLVGT